MEKRIKLNDNRILIYRQIEGYITSDRVITEGFIEEGEVAKSYILTQYDDYSFGAYVKNIESVDKVVFEFNIDHPLYFPLKHLLSKDEELIIDDDHTRYLEKKMLKVKNEDDKITLSYINDLGNSEFDIEKFDVFIKNIVFDGRSKIDQQGKDTKKRLSDFFNEVDRLFNEKEHQITLEEAIERQKILSKK